MRALPHTRSCFVCGESNANGLKLRFQTDGRIVRAQFTPRAEHIGFQGVVHGGILSTVLDEIMVWACAVATRRFAYCAELNVRFQQPAAPNQPLVAMAELTADRRGRIFEAKATMQTQSKLIIASATGKYLPVTAQELGAMAADLIGDASWLTHPQMKSE